MATKKYLSVVISPLSVAFTQPQPTTDYGPLTKLLKNVSETDSEFSENYTQGSMSNPIRELKSHFQFPL
jgi:hypothetical protein